MKEELLSYDDITLIPQYSEVISRSHVDTGCMFYKYKRRNPIISANMETVTGENMAISMWKCGGIGALHRFYNSVEKNVSAYKNVISTLHNESRCDCLVSVGVGTKSKEATLDLYKNGARMFIIDIAHGHHLSMKKMIEWMRENFKDDIFIVAGNVATAEAVKDLESWGANIIKVGISPGATCTTRIVTGHGVPQFSALMECSRVSSVPIIGDGGIKNSGDIAKALIYSDYVMLGSVLAGTNESPGEIVNGRKKHRGSSSYERAGIAKEGVETTVPLKGSVTNLIENLVAGLRSGMSYSNSKDLKSFSARAKWKRQTSHSYFEGTPHIQRGE